MNPFENERKEIDEFSRDELERMFGPTPPEDMDDAEYLLFISGLEPEDVDVEDKDLDKDDEPIQDPAVCADGRCAPEYDDDLEVPEWPEWQEEDEIEEISTDEPLTEDVLEEGPFKAIGKAVKKGFNKVTGKTDDLVSVFASFYIVAFDLNGGNIRFLDANGNASKTAVTFNSLDAAKTAAKNASNTAKCKAIVRGVTKETLNGTDAAGFSTKGSTTTAPLYVYVSGKETLDNTPKLIKSYANLKKQVGANGEVDGPSTESTETGAGEGAATDTGTTTDATTTDAGGATDTAGTAGTDTTAAVGGEPAAADAAATGAAEGEGTVTTAKPQTTGRLIGQAIRQVLGKEMDKAATDRLAKNILATIKKLQGGAK